VQGQGNFHRQAVEITTIYPYQLLMQELVGDMFDVETLLPANASPHSWSPTPSDIARLTSADLVISNGLGLEANLQPYLTRLGDKNIELAGFLDKRALIQDMDAEAKVPDTNALAVNPHIWTSPELLISLTDSLTAVMEERYPVLSGKFIANHKQIVEELQHTDEIIRQERQVMPRPAIVTMHDAFAYFFRRYDIQFIGAIQPAGAKEPSPKELATLAKQIRENKIKTIFIEPQLNPKPAEVLAKELHLRILTYDDLGTTLQAENIAGFLYKNWSILKSGF